MSAKKNVIELKINGARVSRSPIPQVEGIGEDFAKILDEKLRRLLKTITASIVLSCGVRKLNRVLESIPVPSMLGVVQVKNSPTMALVNISNELIFHLADLRMGGDTEIAPAVSVRPITALDCTLARDFIDTLLQSFTAAVAINLGAPGLDWMELDHFEQHVTMARIAPENADVLVINVQLRIGEAARTGDFDLVIPLSVLDSFKAASHRRVAPDRSPALADLWSSRMARAARDAPVKLTSVIHRLQLDIGSIQAWREGDILPIPDGARSRIELMIPGQDTGPVAIGRLGAFEGMKALKLSLPPDVALIDQLRSLTDEKPR